MAGKVPEPGDLDYGEFALNYTDGNLFFKSNANVITNLASSQFVSVTGNVQGGNIVTVGAVSATGNISGDYVLGNGSQLTGIQAGATTTFSSTAPVSPAQGDIWIRSTTGVQYIYFNDGTSSQWADMEAQTSIASGADLSAVSSNILPAANVTYDLGSTTHRWRDIYLSGNTINLGGATIKTDPASGAIALIPEPTEANPNPSGMVVSPSGGITVVATVGGEVSGNAIGNAAASPTAAPVPIDITTSAPTNGQALIWDSSNSEFVPGNVSAGGATVSVYGNISGLPLSNVSTGSMAFVSSNNRLYLWNGTGWFNIALINTNPTITSGANPTYVFATDGTPIVLTLVASDPEGIPLTWSYEVTSGVLGNTATVVNVDNVFTITPSTNDADGGVFQLTFSASDGINIATAASSFTLVFGAADPYYKQSVLLSTTSTNNGTNNTFIDSSTNNFTVTRNGNATQGAFGPFSPAGWSGYFDGTGDFLSVPDNEAFNFTGDFTIECWLYPTSHPVAVYLIGQSSSTDYAPVLLYLSNGRPGIGASSTGSTWAINAFVGTALALNTWSHVAMVRSGNKWSIYVNGVENVIAASTAVTPYNSTDPLGIGGEAAGTLTYPYFGYISNARVVKGTAVYTSNFTPPTAPVTAVSGTSLLTLQSNRFIDNSVNNFAITRNGDTTIDPFSPFDPLAAYDTSINGGSAYFDGTGDYLTVADNAALELGSSNFTIEAWVYPTSASANSIITKRANNSAYGGYSFFLNSSILGFVADDNTSSPWAISMLSGSAVPLNVWSHVAVTRNGSTWTTWLNGVQSETVTSSITINDQATSLAVGAISDGSAPFFGYISNARVVKGTAVYTSNFTPPTAPVTAVSGTSLLLNAINANIYDQTGKVIAETVGDAKTSTSVVKYGTTSMAFDGTGDYLRIPSSTELDFGTGDFTIETWVNFTALTTSRVFLDRWITGNANGWQFYWRSTGTSIVFLTGSSTVLVQDPNGSNIIAGAWNHVAVTRSGTTVRLFVNGIVVATNTSSVSFTNTLPLGVGIQTSTTTNPFQGYLSDTRITKGVARYTTNFTPPTAQLGFNNPE